MVDCYMFFLVLFIRLNLLTVNGFTTIEVSPSLSQTTWASNYVGTLYTVRVSPTTATYDFTWTVSIFNEFFSELLFLPGADCATTATTSSASYTATCSGTETTLSAANPIATTPQISLAINGAPVIATLNTEIELETCNLQRTFSAAISSTATPCDYNCSVTYQCLSGYSTQGGSFYTARCNQFAALDTPDLCTVLSTSDTNGTIPVWGIVLISLGGFIILCACIYIVWKLCKKNKAQIRTVT